MAKRIVSLKDISKACGVSIATVSKALNDHSDISKETKEKIREVAEQLGYHPNAAAQALKTNRSNNIGVLFVDEANSGLTHDYFSHVLDSIKKAAEKEGFDITFINGDRTRSNNMTYLSHAIYRGFDGVVTTGMLLLISSSTSGSEKSTQAIITPSNPLYIACERYDILLILALPPFMKVMSNPFSSAVLLKLSST